MYKTAFSPEPEASWCMGSGPVASRDPSLRLPRGVRIDSRRLAPTQGGPDYAARSPPVSQPHPASCHCDRHRSDRFGSRPSAQRPPLRSERHNGFDLGDDREITRPTTTSSGDVLVASVNARLSSSSAITAPTGWNLIRGDSSGPGFSPLTQALYYKVAGSSEPASYAWSLSSTSSATAAILDFKNVDRTTPVDSHSGAFTRTRGTRLPRRLRRRSRETS